LFGSLFSCFQGYPLQVKRRCTRNSYRRKAARVSFSITRCCAADFPYTFVHLVLTNDYVFFFLTNRHTTAPCTPFFLTHLLSSKKADMNWSRFRNVLESRRTSVKSHRASVTSVFSMCFTECQIVLTRACFFLFPILCSLLGTAEAKCHMIHWGSEQTSFHIWF
jgi:hypothetical protein